MFKTIVVGVDGREGGRDALSLAGRLARMTGAELVAVRVLPLDYYVSRAGTPPYTSIAEHDARAELKKELDEAGVEARIHVFGDRSPARALHRVAEVDHGDLIVVGSTHHGAAARVLAGDDAAATVHGSSWPVAVAPRGFAGRAWPPVTRIGVGFDAGAEARQALELAVALAQQCGAALTVRSVVAEPQPGIDAAPYDTDWLDRAKAAAHEDLRAALGVGDMDISADVVTGAPATELAELSADVDLLVVGSRAWGPVRRILVGSTAARLMRDSHCPVLVLPRGAATGEPGERDPATADTGATSTA